MAGPTRPKGFDRQLRRYWNSAAMSAYTARKLSETDGELIFQYAQAKLVGDLATQRRIAETFSKREAFPEPKPEWPSTPFCCACVS
jgi:hypothetical protein